MRITFDKPIWRGSCGTAGFVFALAISGCEGLTDVSATDVTTPDALANAAGAATLHAGALGTFTIAYAGYPLAQFIYSGLISDEFITAPPQGSWASSDFRVLSDPGETWPYNELHKARIAGLQALVALETFAPEPRSRIGHMFATIGYVEAFFGENFCSGVPLSDLVNQAPVFGGQLTTTLMLERAVQSFDSAIANAGTDAGVLNLARVGRARALLSLGRYVEAASSVTAVPTDFVYDIEMNATSSINYNGQYYNQYLFSYVTTIDNEGSNGLDFVSANDPRVVFQVAPSNYPIPHNRLPKYGTPNAPVELASGIEARLIEAEAAYQANPDDTSPTGSGWLGRLNALRATAISPAMAPLSDPGSRAARVDLLFRERAFWLFATGKRHGDMRRLVREYGRPIASVFPVGFTIHGIPYGDGVNIAPPTAQFNNPQYTGCLDRDP
jgi:hypothetical protein